MRKAYELDAQFMAEFRFLRRYLISDENNWGDDIILHLSRQDALPESFEREDRREISRLYREHSKLFRTGRFDEAYLESIEKIALFYIYHDIKTLWLVGAYREQTSRLINLICTRAALNTRIPLRETMRALTGALILEVNQIQRTYTMYERYVSNSLVKDLTTTGMLTQAATGIKKPTPAPPNLQVAKG